VDRIYYFNNLSVLHPNNNQMRHQVGSLHNSRAGLKH
jgi:hypothetical protein